MSRAKPEPSSGLVAVLSDDTPPGRVLGYARVSTDCQALAPQVESLRAAGAVKVYLETASGAKRDRAQLARLLREVQPSDVVLVTRLDRLARSTQNLLNVLSALAEKGTMFRSLGDPWADTTTPHGRLMLTVLGGLAEFERDLIRARTGEGRARAKREGRKMGRPHKLTPHQQREARRRHDEGESLSSIARSYNVHHATIARLCR
jgi:DNA invertase Pin-like site-specific DNA recombinase